VLDEVGVRGVDEVAASAGIRVEDGAGLRLVGGPAEHVPAETDGEGVEVGASERDHVHLRYPVPVQQQNDDLVPGRNRDRPSIGRDGDRAGRRAVCSISSRRPAGAVPPVSKRASTAGEPESREFSSRRRGSASLTEGSVGESESPRIRAFRVRNRSAPACLAGEQSTGDVTGVNRAMPGRRRVLTR
jgi:hypothetical protein